MHAGFPLNSAGDTIVLLTADGRVVDFVNYPALPADHSFGRFPDGAGAFRVLSFVTPAAPNVVPISPLILNEFNAVQPTKKLDNLGSDPFLGRIDGNGGNWFELVVTSDHLDVRGWTLRVTNNTGPEQTGGTLEFFADPICASNLGCLAGGGSSGWARHAVQS